MSEDPIGFGDDTNLYKYVLNNPSNATDPSGLLTFFEAYSHYIGGSGTPLTQNFSEINTSMVKPSDFSQVKKALNSASNQNNNSSCSSEPEKSPKQIRIDDRRAFKVPGFKVFTFGNITLRLQGTLNIYESTWEFNGTLKAFDDTFDFNPSTHRGDAGENLTTIGRQLPGKSFLIQIRGAKNISERGYL